MTVNITTPSALKYAKVLIFAPPGHGKTFFLGTAQDDDRTYPMLLLDFEAGTETLDGLDIDVVPIRSWRDSDEVLEMLQSGDHDYKSVGIDSISEWHRWALLDILDKAGPSRNDPDLLEQRDYGKAGVQLRRVLRKYRDLPLHVFFSAHAKMIDEPRLGRVTVPDMAGQMSQEVSGLVSVVGYLAVAEGEDGEDERLLLLRDYPKYKTKARTPWLEVAPSEIVDPDVTGVLDALGYKVGNNGRKSS